MILPTDRHHPAAALACLVILMTGCGSDAAEGDDSAASCAAPLSLDPMKVTVAGTDILDSHGRQLILRGVNTGGRAKLPPFVAFPFSESGRAEQAGAPPFDQALAAYADRVLAWGHNVVRLPFTWHAVEPERGTYDETFVARYEAIAQAFSDRGIRVIVDFHQDVFATAFCGDGFPPWAILEPVDPDVDRDCHQWFLGYLQDDEVKAAYDRFWANEGGLRGDFGNMWRHMAGRLWKVPGVIGFEMINEPGWGTADPAEWGPQVMQPFYTEVAAAIREVAPGAPVFFDSTGSDAIQATTHVLPPDGGNAIFAPHYYDAPVILQGRWGGKSDVSEPIGQWRALGDKWKVPVLVGEFGIRSTAEGGAQYVRLNFDALDEHLLHGTLWEYSTTTDDWNEEGMSIVRTDGQDSPLVAEVIRAYPRAVAGRLESFAFDREQRTGTLVFDASAGGVSELAAPTLLYPDGVTATIDGSPGCASYDAATGIATIRVDEASRVTVSFGPAI